MDVHSMGVLFVYLIYMVCIPLVLDLINSNKIDPIMIDYF